MKNIRIDHNSNGWYIYSSDDDGYVFYMDHTIAFGSSVGYWPTRQECEAIIQKWRDTHEKKTSKCDGVNCSCPIELLMASGCQYLKAKRIAEQKD